MEPKEEAGLKRRDLIGKEEEAEVDGEAAANKFWKRVLLLVLKDDDIFYLICSNSNNKTSKFVTDSFSCKLGGGALETPPTILDYPLFLRQWMIPPPPLSRSIYMRTPTNMKTNCC